jgi:hypothetical protein
MLKLLQAVAVCILTVASLANTVQLKSAHLPSGAVKLNMLIYTVGRGM